MNIRTLKIFAKASLTTLVSLGVVQFSACADDPIEMMDVTAAVGLDNDFFYSDTGHSLGAVSYTHLPSPRDLSTSRMPSSA